MILIQVSVIHFQEFVFWGLLQGIKNYHTNIVCVHCINIKVREIEIIYTV